MLDRHNINMYYFLMEIRVLRYFLAVAHEGSITNAANYLHLTQPTLSRQLQDLERGLNQQLFIRGAHNITLTQEGLILKKRAEEIIELVDKTEAELNVSPNDIKGEIHIGAGETVLIDRILDVIKEMKEYYPNISYRFYSGNAEDVEEKLDSGILDFGFIGNRENSKYDYIKIPSADIWGVLMRKDDVLAKKKYIVPDDIKEQPLIFSRQALKNNDEKNIFSKWFGVNVDNLNIPITYNLIFNAALMAKKGLGYVMCLNNLANTSLDSDLCFRPLKPEFNMTWIFAWKKGQVFSKAAQIFLERVQEKIK